MHIKITQVRVGSKVIIRGAFGTGESIAGTVQAVESAIKNGHPGVSYVTDKGDSHWAYLDQIVRVVNF